MTIFKSILISSLVLLTIFAYGQRRVSLPFSKGFDEEADIQIGLLYNYINQNYQLRLHSEWQSLYGDDSDIDDITYLGEIKQIRAKSGHGFSIGIPVDFRITNNFLINFSPSFTILNSLGVEYVSMDEEIKPILRKTRHVVQNLQGDNFNSFEVPLSLKIRSEEKKIAKSEIKYRGYLLGGARLTKWIGLGSEQQKAIVAKAAAKYYPETLILKSEYVSWEAGFGFDIYFSFFKVSPEFRFNQSVANVLNNKHVLSTDNKFMKPIDKAYIRNVYFSLIFQ